MDETLPVLVKLTVAREQNRERMERSRSNNRGRSILSKRIGCRADIVMENLHPSDQDPDP